MALKFGKNVTGPSITAVIKVDGAAVDLTGATVRFRMRHIDGTTLKVNVVATVLNQTTNKGGVQYDWGATDLDTMGAFKFWWHVTLPTTQTFETPEQDLIVDEHAPGDGVLTGVIAKRLKSFIPSTFNAMVSDDRYGDIEFQTKIDLVKYRLFGTIIDADDEVTTYNTLVIDYAAKLALLEVIPAAVDFWSRQPIALTTTGTNESVSYPDIISNLWEIYERTWADIKRLEPEIGGIIDVKVRKRGGGPKVDTSASDMVTPNPQDIGPPFGPKFSDTLPWKISS